MEKRITIFLIFIIILCAPSDVSAARGCCSHHGGVSGCSSSGRQICKDGTLSPTCTCTPVITYTYGCTDKNASNYNPKANRDNGTCIYYVYGCTDKAAKNYNSKANKDNGACEYYVYGCTDILAINYNPKAELDDGTCIFYVSHEVEKVDDNDEQRTTDDSEIIDTIIGMGIVSGGIYLYKRRKNSSGAK